MKYALVSIDWNPEQTKLWLKCIEKYSPKAKVILFPEVNRIGCWSCAKLTCFEDHPGYEDVDYIIYTDTDVLILHELEDVLGMIGDADVGLSLLREFTSCASIDRRIKEYVFGGRVVRGGKRKADKNVPGVIKEMRSMHGKDTSDLYNHYSSGMVILKASFRADFLASWEAWCERMLAYPYFKDRRHFEEVTLSLWLLKDQLPVWWIPPKIHDNLLRPGRLKETPWVLHYHNFRRLHENKLWGLAEECMK